MIAHLSIPSPPPEWSSFQIPLGFTTLTIHAYAICILVGIIVATIWTGRRLTSRGAEPGVVLDIVLFAVPLGIIGARAYHVLTHPDDYFYPGANVWNPFEPGAIWNIWDGGGAIFGALIGGGIGALIGCRITGIRFLSFADALAPAMLAAQAFGRLGNWFNHELFGQPTTLPWGLEIESTNPAWPAGLPDGTLFQPTFLYEIIWNLALAAFLVWLGHHRKIRPPGLFALYVMGYSAFRIFEESLRVDPAHHILGQRLNFWVAIVLSLIGFAWFLWTQRDRPGADDPPVVQPAEGG